jgi:hypothetical protein
MRMIFVNLPIKDIEATKRFYTGLGFSLNEQFCSEQSVAVVIEENIVFMMLTHDHFSQFLKGGIADISKDKEALICLSASGREEVDGFLQKALANGGSEWMPAQDHGFMYGVSFTDPDGHVLEVMWMDPAAVEQGQHMEIELA